MSSVGSARTPEFSPRPKKRVVARLLAHLTAIGAGLFYVIHPPITTTTYLDATWPARTWGAFFIAGGIIAAFSWWHRLLTIKRIGLILEITALVALTAAQMMVMFDQGISWTRGGTVMALLFGIFLLAAYWQDVAHYEREADQAEEAKSRLDAHQIIHNDHGSDEAGG